MCRSSPKLIRHQLIDSIDSIDNLVHGRIKRDEYHNPYSIIQNRPLSKPLLNDKGQFLNETRYEALLRCFERRWL